MTDDDITYKAFRDMVVLLLAIQKVNETTTKCPIIQKLIDQYLDKHEPLIFKKEKQ